MRLSYELNCAKLMAPEQIRSTVVTMNSIVLLRDRISGRVNEVTVTYPRDVNPRENKVSVFSPIGIALLGKDAGRVVAWNTPVGLRQFEILKVVFQPEAVGDYSL
jgi:regulator of nucleoside diphosphate kinase